MTTHPLCFRSGLGVGRNVAIVAMGLMAGSCGARQQSVVEPQAVGTGRADGGAGSAREPVFREVAAASGLDFVHFNGMTGEFYYAEIMGSGVALFDYDNDGDLDIYLVQGGMLQPGIASSDADFPPTAAMLPLQDRLFRNDLQVRKDGRRELRFTDVTEESGIRAVHYGMGVVAADLDNDGWTDLYVTNAGPNQIFLNNGDGTFTEAPDSGIPPDSSWSLSVTAFDYDRDGWLDLYVANYVDFSVADNQHCRSLIGAPDYCGPQTYPPLGDRLLHNRGQGEFEDVTDRAGIGAEIGASMGLVSGDFNRDGWPDIYVANDGMPNVMWINQRDGTFENKALIMGVGLNRDGLAEAGMGIAVSDIDGDGGEDLLVTNLTQETNTLYRSRSASFFEDDSIASGLGPPSWASTGFGVAWIDIGNSGRLDLVVANGSVFLIPDLVDRGDPYPLHQPNRLFRQAETGRFELADHLAFGGLARSEVSRGLARGDLDNDGDLDLVITNNNGPVRLLLNTVGQSHPWLGLELVGSRTGRNMLGAVVELELQSGKATRRRLRTGGSYLSSHDARLHFGLSEVASAQSVDAVVVEWLRGERERFDVEINSYQTLRQGQGAPVVDRVTQ